MLIEKRLLFRPVKFEFGVIIYKTTLQVYVTDGTRE